jgi:hypothetical protein
MPFRLLTDKQIRRRARRDIQSVLRPLSRQSAREALAGERNIAGIAASLAAAQGGYQGKLSDIYSRARTNLGALDVSQRGQLGSVAPGGASETGTLEAGLRQRLALSGGDTNLANALQTQTQGAASAGYGIGSAEVGALAQRQAAAEEFGAKLPELARLTGLQGVQERAARQRQEQARLQAQMAQQGLSQINAERNRNFQRGAANLAYSGDVMEERGRNARESAKLTVQQQRANEAARHNAAMESIDQTTAAGKAKADAERARHNKVKEGLDKQKAKSAAKKERAFDPVNSKRRGVRVRKDGTIIKGKDGKPIPYHGADSGGGGSGGW